MPCTLVLEGVVHSKHLSEWTCSFPFHFTVWSAHPLHQHWSFILPMTNSHGSSNVKSITPLPKATSKMEYLETEYQWSQNPIMVTTCQCCESWCTFVWHFLLNVKSYNSNQGWLIQNTLNFKNLEGHEDIAITSEDDTAYADSPRTQQQGNAKAIQIKSISYRRVIDAKL